MNGIDEAVWLFGASGHARVVLDALRREGLRRVLGVVDPGLPRGSEFAGLRVLGGDEDWIEEVKRTGCRMGVLGLGDNDLRRRVAMDARERVADFRFVPVIHPDAVVAEEARVEDGAVVLAGAVVAPGAVVGEGALVNHRALLDHESILGAFASLAPGAVVCGRCDIGAGAAVGAGATVIQNLRMGDGAMLGAGGVLLRDLAPGAVAWGVPARVMRERGRER